MRKRILFNSFIVLLLVMAFFVACTPESPKKEEPAKQEQTEKPSDDPKNKGDESKDGDESGGSGTSGGEGETTGGDSGTSGGDSGTTGGDSGTSGGDSGTSGGDSGTSGGDSGTSGGDSGTSGGDSGTSGGDSGTSGGETGGDTPTPTPSISYIDVNLVSNASFEKFNGENKPENTGSNGFVKESDASNIHTGTASIYSAEQEGERYIYTEPVTLAKASSDGKTRVKASVWMKLENATDCSNIKLILENQIGETNSSAKEVNPASSTDWQEVVLEYETDQTVANFTLKVVISGSADPKVKGVYLDDFSLVAETADIDFVRNGSFNVDTAWGNYGDLKVADQGVDGSVAMSLNSNVDKDTFTSTSWFGESAPKYDGTKATVFSVFMKKADGATGKIKLRYEAKEGLGDVSKDFDVSEAADWTKISIEIPAVVTDGKTLSEMLVHIARSTDFSGVVYFDNASWTLK